MSVIRERLYAHLVHHISRELCTPLSNIQCHIQIILRSEALTVTIFS